MNRNTIILLSIGILAIAGYFVYKQTGVVEYEKKRSEALEMERNELWDQVGTLKKNVAELAEELALHKEPIIPGEKLNEVFGEPASEPAPRSAEIDCQKLEEQAQAIFAYLDTKEYEAKHGIETGTYALIAEIAGKLSGKPPMVSGEMRDMVSLARNVAHFYRVLGENRVAVLQDIMASETDVMESFLAVCYPWLMTCQQCRTTALPCPSLETMYQYAGFFLNTLAGKSYLMRRESKLRVLVSYYSVLILDKANKDTLNSHGIDIRPFIEASLNEIRNQRGLVYKKQYVDVLRELKKQYQM